MADSARVEPLNPDPEAANAEAEAEAPQSGHGRLSKTLTATKNHCLFTLPVPLWVLYLVLAVVLFLVLRALFYWIMVSSGISAYAPTISILGINYWHGQWEMGDSKLKSAKLKLTTSKDIKDEGVKNALLNLGPDSSKQDLERLDSYIKKNKIDVVTFGMSEWKIEPLLKLYAKGWPLSAPLTNQGMSNEAGLLRVVDKDNFQQTMKDNGLESYTIPSYKAASLVTCKELATPESADPVSDRCQIDEDAVTKEGAVFPLFVKPVQGAGGTSHAELYKKVDTREALAEFFNTPVKTSNGGYKFILPSDFTVQEWVTSKYEDSFHFVYSEEHGGFLKLKITRDEYQSDDAVAHHNPTRKRTTLERDFVPKQMVENFGKLLRAVNYRGIGCFDMKYRNSDLSQPMVMEMNPRICGSQPHFHDYGAWVRAWTRLYVVKE
uniref:ATP-grasp domain-containing protein n=1 Tax=Chromera velia CCMP2878 TaxID=1169474 RepID=A0A0G4FRH2_9ALVE|eukprot:Cvel_446.t1-p1 / transcript=Cvel_446.t1 / gene=Cvel_446 / organism=Chromera_velia_CCMP2878 / gene_product=hypothetical protein / transcript_product=hypothetical protein / location=Cvel_scaffold14:122950-124251(-) / protein_length=434 / sequence_SO=supercontig / SO=protein_coding / is_pseudo=false